MKHTHHPKEFKIQVCKEAIDTGNAAVVARRYELCSNIVTVGLKNTMKENTIT